MIVLLVIEGFEWIFGQMADFICRYNPDISFIYTDTGILNRDRGEFEALVKQSDLVHWITNVAYTQQQDVAQWSLTARPSIASLYHVAAGEDGKVDAISSASCIHVMSSEWHDYLVTHAQKTISKIAIIPLGVDTTFYRFSNHTKKRAGQFKIGCFGNPNTANNRKGADVLLDAFSQLDQNMYQLILAGPGWGDFLANKERLNIKNYGYVGRGKLRYLYRSLDAYVIASRVEGGPVTLLEAFASGVPVITTPVGMSRDIVNHNVNGIIVPINSPRDLVDQIEVMRTNRKRNDEIRSKARLDVEPYDWKIIAPRFGDLYRKVLSENGSIFKQSLNVKIDFRAKRISPYEQRKIISSEKRINYLLSLIGQRNFLVFFGEFLRLSPRYWTLALNKIYRRISGKL